MNSIWANRLDESHKVRQSTYLHFWALRTPHQGEWMKDETFTTDAIRVVLDSAGDVDLPASVAGSARYWEPM